MSIESRIKKHAEKIGKPELSSLRVGSKLVSEKGTEDEFTDHVVGLEELPSNGVLIITKIDPTDEGEQPNEMDMSDLFSCDIVIE